MKEVNKLKISEASSDDYAEVVDLFNKNQVYQFPDGIPLTVQDLDLTMKIKEVTNLFLLKNNGSVIGTSAFFKFITHECLDWDSSFSGFLLIDSESRSGQAITYLYKTILESITDLGIANLYTEVSKYNKPSLSLSKLNGFKEYSETYEDILHCRSLRSNLPKILKTFRISDYHGKEYDLSTFQVLEELENPSEKETHIRTMISDEEILFKVADNVSLPYYLKMDLFEIGIMKEGNHYLLRAEFLSDDVEKIRVKVGNYRFETLTRNKSVIQLNKRSDKYYVQSSIVTKDGNIDVQLERRKEVSSPAEIPLNRKFQGYDLSISPMGSLNFSKQGRVLLEDSFLLFSRPSDACLVVKEGKDNVKINLSYQGVSIQKTITFVNDEQITCSYHVNQKERDKFPDLLKQAFKIYPQEHLIRDVDGYRANIPGGYPVEHDDFIRADDFEEKIFSYYLPSEGQVIHYQPPGKASNQMQFRPLSVVDGANLTKLTYQFTISSVGIGTKAYEVKGKWEKQHTHQATTKNLLKQVYRISLEQEMNYGTKRMIANRKEYPANNLVLSHNQIVLPDSYVPRDSDLYSISFDYKIRGGIEQLRYGERVSYTNKSHILENDQELLLYDASQDSYLRFFAKGGVFYSYRENNSLKVRCVFTTKSSHATNVSITEYRKSEENEYII